MNCNDAMAALVASLENGTAVTGEQREHIRTCPRCGGMLDSAKELLAAPEPGPAVGMDAALAAAEHEVRRARFWRNLKAILGIAVLFALVIAALFFQSGDVAVWEALLVAGASLLVALLAVAPLLLILWLVRGTTLRLYKRLGPGRMLSGVCLGIAEATKVDVRLLRIFFLVLLFFNGAGFWIYVLFALAMPVHPDDRQYLLRFRLRRWLNRRSSHATGG